MKKVIGILIMVLGLSAIYGQSVGDLTLIYEPTGELINFYDEPSRFFTMIGQDASCLKDIPVGFSENFQGKNFHARIWKRVLKVQSQIDKYEPIEVNLDWYTFEVLRVSKDFRTVRGIEIGSDIKEVMEKYPEYVFYRVTGEHQDWYHDGRYQVTYKSGEKLPKNITYVAAYWDYRNKVRSGEFDMAMVYGLVFYMDKDEKVSQIEMNFAFTAP